MDIDNSQITPNPNITTPINLNKPIKPIKKLDLKSIGQIEKTKSQILTKSDIEKETSLMNHLISKDLEKYIEFLSNEDYQCDKMSYYQVPYYFLGINNKQSLSTNGKEIRINDKKDKDNFFSKLEKKFIKENTHQFIPLSCKKNKKLMNIS